MKLTSTRIKQLIKEEIEKINEEEAEEEHDLISQTLDKFLDRTQTIDEEKKLKSRGSTLALDYWKEDRETFNKIWMKKNPNIKPWGYELLKKAAIEFTPFDETNLMSQSQGPSGRWKFTNNIYSKIIVSEKFFFIRKYFRIIIKMITSYTSLKYYLRKLIT